MENESPPRPRPKETDAGGDGPETGE
jgi:hypothetical protein